MDPECLFGSVEPQRFQALLQDYPSVVPEALSDLDRTRYDSLPSVVAERNKSGNAHLTLDEVRSLVDWKLSHGKFRPTLKALVKQNHTDTVRELTKEAFVGFKNDTETARSSLKQLSQLRGIGPATASLLLSVYAPAEAPFFSDELFRWASWEDKRGAGWDRPIKYTPKEYDQLFQLVLDFRTRFQDEYQTECSAADVERVAYVLGRRAATSPDLVATSTATGSRSSGGRKEIPTGKRKAAREALSGPNGADAGEPERVKKSKKSASPSAPQPVAKRSSSRIRRGK